MSKINPRITEYMERCMICGRLAEWHHALHGTANRKLASEDGLVVPLCPYHHRESYTAVHRDEDMNLLVEMIGQQAFMMNQLEDGKASTKEEAREQFIKRYGKAYL